MQPEEQARLVIDEKIEQSGWTIQDMSRLIRFTGYKDVKYRSRTVFSFFRPETLKSLLSMPDTIRNNIKRFPPLDGTGFRKFQIKAINNLDTSFAENRPKALVQMATGAGETFTAITAAYRLIKYGKKNAARLMRQLIEYRDRLSRTMRWQQMDEDYFGVKKSKLDKDVVNPSQIRNVMRTFKENLFTSLFPNRKEVPKTLIYAKIDSQMMKKSNFP